MTSSSPDGQLTPAQHEIMQIIWSAGKAGISVGDIWKEVQETREVARTTILTLVERLETRGWLIRQAPRPTQKGSAMRFTYTTSRLRTRALLLQQFVNDYYDGSAVDLAQNLLRFRCLSQSVMQELKQLLVDRLK